MFVQTATAMLRAVFPFVVSFLLSSCAASRPTPPPAPVTPPEPPPFKIPGEPVALTPAEQAMGNFLKGKVALDQGDQDTAFVSFEQAVNELWSLKV